MDSKCVLFDLPKSYIEKAHLSFCSNFPLDVTLNAHRNSRKSIVPSPFASNVRKTCSANYVWEFKQRLKFNVFTTVKRPNTHFTGITVREKVTVNLFKFLYWQMATRAIFEKAFVPFLNFGIWKSNGNELIYMSRRFEHNQKRWHFVSFFWKNVFRFHWFRTKCDSCCQFMQLKNDQSATFRWKTYRWIRCSVLNLLRLLVWVYCFAFPCWCEFVFMCMRDYNF